jgi:hypothetical protein
MTSAGLTALDALGHWDALQVGAGGESGTCRIAHGAQAAIEVASAVKA